jgi:hypothetical protein
MRPRLAVLAVAPAACLAVAFGVALAACAPREARVPISEEARDAPPPRLAETALFDSALAGAAPDAERLGADADALAARAEALRARAAALDAPVLDPAVRPRLEAGPAPVPEPD